MRAHSILLVSLLCWPALAACASEANASAPRLVLDNGVVHFEATSAFGGRGLVWQLKGEANVLKIGDAVEQQPSPEVTADSGDIAYLGHDVWVGPQSQWWLHQDVNAPRRESAAIWPPDPFLSLAAARVVGQDRRRIELEGTDSPVSGVRLRKTFALLPDDPHSLSVMAEARNTRQTPVAWDLWFNTRVAASTRVYVPVAAAADFDLQAKPEEGVDPPQHRWTAGLFELTAQWADLDGMQRGKYRLQPSAGWMAGFMGNQVLLIRFDHQPRERIHPEQGQVELYLEAPWRSPVEGLLEMEVHAPFRTLGPQERMEAAERWTLLRYDGPDTPQAQRAFLCEQASRLSLAHACGS